MYNIKIYNLDNGKHINFVAPEGFAITEISGLNSTSIEHATSQGFKQVGSTLQGSSVQDRLITITGAFIGQSRDLRKQLLDTIVPPKNPESTNLKVVFNNMFFEMGILETMDDVTNHMYSAMFQFIIRCPYPYWRSLEMIKTTLGGIEGKFMFPVDYGNPAVPDLHYFGVRTEESYKNILNEGNVPVPFKILFYARTTLTNPIVQNIETLEYIGMSKEMKAGEIITIDQTESILGITSTTGSITEDDMSFFNLSSTLFKLGVGDNLIRFDADSNKDGLDCFIYHYLTLAGVYGDDITYI